MLDSVAAGRKLAETKYKVLSASETQHSIREMTVSDTSKSRSVSREAGEDFPVEISSSSQDSVASAAGGGLPAAVAHETIEITSSQ